VSGYSINQSSGALTTISGSPFQTGEWPGGLTIDLSGRFLYTANFASDNSSGFAINPLTGALTAMPGSPFATGYRPISVTTVGATDTTPPLIKVSVAPKQLWPPNGKMVPVTISGTITDTGSGVNASSAAYAVQDEYGEVQPTGAITLGPGGSYSFTVLLQASRLGIDLDGRRYTVTVSASDNAGNAGSESGAVIVPHDQRH
jgi:hypothetical protein